MTQQPKFKIGQIVSYRNGSLSVYTGEIKSVRPNAKSYSYIIIDRKDLAGQELYNAGYAVGSDIAESQILN